MECVDQKRTLDTVLMFGKCKGKLRRGVLHNLEEGFLRTIIG